MRFLHEILGTKYLTADYAEDLRFLLEQTQRGISTGTRYEGNIYTLQVKEAINAFIEAGRADIDIVDCRFVGAVWNVIRMWATKYPDIIQFTDSGDNERDAFIRTMCYESVHKNVATCKLPIKPASIEDFAEWAQRLDPNEVYDAMAYNKHPEFLLLLQLFRPEIQIIGSYKDMFDYGKRVLSRVLWEECHEFLYIPGIVDEFWMTRLSDNGTVHVVNIGDIPKREFITKYKCIPADVGSKQFIAATSSDAWREGVAQILKDVAAYLSKRPITIGTYYPEEIYDN